MDSLNSNEPDRNLNFFDANGLDISRTELLLRQLSANIKWVEANINAFEPIIQSELDPSRLKAFGELTLALEVLNRHPNILETLFLNQTFNKMWRFVVNRTLSEVQWQSAKRNPTHWFMFCLPYLVIRATNYNSPAFDSTVRWLVERGISDSLELEPYRVLDKEFFLWRSQLNLETPNWTKLYKDTFLGHTRDILYFNLDAAYSITHTIFYLTDFGHSLPLTTVCDYALIADLLESAIVHYWRDQNWDLMGEFLLCWEALQLPTQKIILAAEAAFCRATLASGGIPSNAKITLDDANNFSFLYHTTLVSMLYCSITLTNLSNSKLNNSLEPKPPSSNNTIQKFSYIPQESLRDTDKNQSSQNYLTQADLNKAVTITLDWMKQINAHYAQESALLQLAKLYCDSFEAGVLPLGDEAKLIINRPPFSSIVTLPKQELLALIDETGASVVSKKETDQEIGDLLAHLALAFAREGDLLAVIRIMPAACQLGCRSTLTRTLLRYLLDQQDADGAFGLYAAEIEVIEDGKILTDEVKLKITVRVLRAIAYGCENLSKNLKL